jgi:hypothetical protein
MFMADWTLQLLLLVLLLLLLILHSAEATE